MVVDSAMAPPRMRIRLHREARLHTDAAGVTRLVFASHDVPLGVLDQALLTVLAALGAGDVDERELMAGVLAEHGPAGMHGARALLATLRAGNLLRVTLEHEAAGARDPRLPQLREARRRLRHESAEPLTAGQLGEFLHRAARSRGVRTHDGVGPGDPPHPSGSPLHELGLYPVVGTVAGIPAGLYHYDAVAHRLELVCANSLLARPLIAHAARTAELPSDPQVLIVITARFGRVVWKYQSMAYALTLRNVGLLFSAMYGVAAAMELTPCALGGRAAHLFGQAVGLDESSEATVGGFLLGPTRGLVSPHRPQVTAADHLNGPSRWG
jgi:SagB-type dehydrogenase family enzyme